MTEYKQLNNNNYNGLLVTLCTVNYTSAYTTLRFDYFTCSVKWIICMNNGRITTIVLPIHNDFVSKNKTIDTNTYINSSEIFLFDTSKLLWSSFSKLVNNENCQFFIFRACSRPIIKFFNHYTQFTI